jgi:hypothetical protein
LPQGLNDQQVTKLKEFVQPYTLPEEFIILFKWHNGLRVGEIELFTPIEENMYVYKEVENDYDTDQYFTMNGFETESEGLAVDMKEKTSALLHPSMKQYDKDYENEHASISRYMSLVLKYLKTGIIYYEKDTGSWEYDSAKLKTIPIEEYIFN